MLKCHPDRKGHIWHPYLNKTKTLHRNNLLKFEVIRNGDKTRQAYNSTCNKSKLTHCRVCDTRQIPG